MALAALAAVVAGIVIVVAEPAAAATPPTTQAFSGSAAGANEKEWFNTAFGFDAGALGKVRGRLRFVTDTTATLSASRTVSAGEPRSYAAGANVSVHLTNTPTAARLRVLARPALQLVFEWQPKGDPLVCNPNAFPDMGGDWFRRTDGGGPVGDGLCGAVEVTADDLNPIFQQLGIDLELPEVFAVLDKSFSAGFTGTSTLSESHELFEIRVCKIASDFFGLPIGDRCGVQLNAVATTPLTTLGQTATAQGCTSAFVPATGSELPCALNVGPAVPLTFTSPSKGFSLQGMCPEQEATYDLRLSQLRWQSRLENVNIGLAADFNVRLLEDGDGWDVATVTIPGSISLLTSPMPLDVAFTPTAAPMHLGQVSPDTDPPLALVAPVTMTDEGSPATVTPFLADACTATEDLEVRWAIDPRPTFGHTLTKTYANDLPNPSHKGVLRVTDQRGNVTEAPFEIRVRNVAPGVTLTGLPRTPVAVGTTTTFSAPVTDPGADTVSWSWSFGDGGSATRTAAGPADRSDSQPKAYSVPGLYPVRVTVADGTDQTAAAAELPVFDPASKLVGTAAFTADAQSVGVPQGSTYRVAANLGYRDAAFPVGTFTTDFTKIVNGSPRQARLSATTLEWYLERHTSAMLQGLATVDGETGWKFRLTLTRSASSPIGSTATMSVWRPGTTTLENPDYRFGGPRDTGTLV